MYYVNIVKGFHRGVLVTGLFAVEKPFNGKFVTLRTEVTPPFQVPTPRVKFESQDDFFYCDHEGNKIELTVVPPAIAGMASNVPRAMLAAEPDYSSLESYEEAELRISTAFEMLDDISRAAIRGDIRGLVVFGPPGVGKTHGLKKILDEVNLFNIMRNGQVDYDIVRGNASALGLYKTLYNFREKHQVIILDDCDSVLYDEVGLNLLKAALDSSEIRRLSWRTESRVLSDDDIPKDFEFHGSIIFLTNIDFDRSRSSKLADHLAAIKSRCHYLDLGIRSQRDKLIRVKQVVDAGMLTQYAFDDSEVTMILNFIEEHAEDLYEVSLRMVKKIADFVKMNPSNWERYVEATCITREGVHKRRLLRANEE